MKKEILFILFIEIIIIELNLMIYLIIFFYKLYIR